MSGLIGIKCGTSRLYNEHGGVEQVTVIKIFPNFVAEKKTTEKHGYAALQLASLPAQKQLQKVKAGLYGKLKILSKKRSRSLSLTQLSMMHTSLVVS